MSLQLCVFHIAANATNHLNVIEGRMDGAIYHIDVEHLSLGS